MAPVDIKNQHGVGGYSIASKRGDSSPTPSQRRVRRTDYRYVAKPKRRFCWDAGRTTGRHSITLSNHYASHTMAPAERKERNRVGGGAGAKCRVLCQCSQQLELDPRLAGKVIIMPENMSDKPRVSGATQTASPEACEKGVLSRTSKLKWTAYTRPFKMSQCDRHFGCVQRRRE